MVATQNGPMAPNSDTRTRAYLEAVRYAAACPALDRTGRKVAWIPAAALLTLAIALACLDLAHLWSFPSWWHGVRSLTPFTGVGLAFALIGWTYLALHVASVSIALAVVGPDVPAAVTQRAFWATGLSMAGIALVIVTALFILPGWRFSL
jgi:hypothetical protein